MGSNSLALSSIHGRFAHSPTLLLHDVLPSPNLLRIRMWPCIPHARPGGTLRQPALQIQSPTPEELSRSVLQADMQAIPSTPATVFSANAWILSGLRRTRPLNMITSCKTSPILGSQICWSYSA